MFERVLVLGSLTTILVIEQTELVFDHACVPLNQVNDPSEEDRGAFV